MSAMNRNAVEEIKSRIPIEDLIGSYIKLEKSGKTFKARCPFHNEKSPSFFVSPDRGGYYCFGCNAKGDIFSFVEQFEGLDFRGALKILAERAGVKLVHDEKADGERDRLYRVMELATTYFEEQFVKSAEAKKYVKNRGIHDETRKVFRIGFAPDGWRNLMTYLKGKGFNEAVMEKVGLIKEKEGTSDYYDRFRGRIMFPISDSSGRVIAFSGRILKDEKMPDGISPAKYLNSPDSPLFDKSLVLYGLDKAKTEIRRLNYTIFVEGQMDLVMSHQAGIKNTVASSGTAMTEETVNSAGIISNLGLVRRLSPNMIIAFDSDSAGRKAALRAAGIALSLGMDVKIADITGGKDPADLVKENVEKWRKTLKDAKPVIEFELRNVVRENSESDKNGATKDARKLTKAITERVLPLIARIESSSDQSHFVAMVADQAKLPIDVVWQDVRVVAKRQKEADAAANPVMNQFGKNVNLPKSNARTTSEMGRRVDLIERRLFGLLFLVDRIVEQSENDDLISNLKSLISGSREQIKKMAGDSYEARSANAEANKNDLMFEAESFFGTDSGKDGENWSKPMKELLMNFEEDLISDEIIGTMHELKIAEKAGEHAKVVELAKKCQALSIRKAQVRKG
jgi:DNA primase